MQNRLGHPRYINTARIYLEEIEELLPTLDIGEAKKFIRGVLTILGFAGDIESTTGFALYSRGVKWQPSVRQSLTWISYYTGENARNYHYKMYLTEWQEFDPAGGEYIEHQEIDLKQFLEEAIKSTLIHEDNQLRGA